MRLLRSLLVVVILTTGVYGWCSAQVTVPTGVEKSRLVLMEQDSDSYLYRAEVGNLEAVEVGTSEGTFTRLLLPGFHSSKQEGAPELPMMNRLIEIPQGAAMRIEILSQTTRSVNLGDYGIEHPLFPAQPSMPKSADPASWPFIIDRAAYASPRQAADLVVVREVGQLRAVRMARLEISPVEYFPGETRILVTDASSSASSLTGPTSRPNRT